MTTEQDQGLLAALEERRSDLRRFLVARTGSEAEADDCLSELWIKVSTMRPGPIASPESYLFGMANNLVLDRRRTQQRRERREYEWTAKLHGAGGTPFEIADDAPDPERLILDRQEAERLADAIAQLPAGAQRVLRRHKLDGLSHGEVAEELGISKSAVEKHMAVAMTHLRRLLED